MALYGIRGRHLFNIYVLACMLNRGRKCNVNRAFVICVQSLCIDVIIIFKIFNSFFSIIAA